MNHRIFYWINGLVTFMAMSFLFYIIYFKSATKASVDLSWLPGLNATLNGLSASFVIGGIMAIKRREFNTHKIMMLCAFMTSTLFLLSYIYYHHYHGDTLFTSTGWIRPIYFFILISHILLSMIVFPMITATLFFAFTKKFATHKNLARWTYPLWLYVSITGIAIYFLLKFVG